MIEHVFSRCSRATADEPAGEPSVQDVPAIVFRGSMAHLNCPAMTLPTAAIAAAIAQAMLLRI